MFPNWERKGFNPFCAFSRNVSYNIDEFLTVIRETLWVVVEDEVTCLNLTPEFCWVGAIKVTSGSGPTISAASLPPLKYLDMENDRKSPDESIHSLPGIDQLPSPCSTQNTPISQTITHHPNCSSPSLSQLKPVSQRVPPLPTANVLGKTPLQLIGLRVSIVLQPRAPLHAQHAFFPLVLVNDIQNQSLVSIAWVLEQGRNMASYARRESSDKLCFNYMPPYPPPPPPSCHIPTCVNNFNLTQSFNSIWVI